MKSLFFILAVVMFSSLTAQAAEFELTLTGNQAKKLFEAGKVEANTISQLRDVGISTYEVSKFGNFSCYKLIETSFKRQIWQGLSGNLDERFSCYGTIAD